MKKIYIVLTYTGTVLSKLIKLYTRNEFCHSSIALDESLQEMYSFGRLNPYNPFIGGFTKEGISFGTFKRFKNTNAAVYSLKVTNKKFNKLKNTLKKMKHQKKEYQYNFLGLVACALNIRLKRDKHFYCSEFMKYLLEGANISQLGVLPNITRPEDLKKIKNLHLEYKGKLQNYFCPLEAS